MRSVACGIIRPQRVEDRCVRQLDRVARPGRRETPAVEHDQRDTGDGFTLGHQVLLRRSVAGGDQSSEVIGLQACAADQAAVDVGLCQQLSRVLRLHRATVKNADTVSAAPASSSDTRMNAQASCAISLVATLPVPIAQTGSYAMTTSLSFSAGTSASAGLDLRLQNCFSLVGLALGVGLTDAEDRLKVVLERDDDLGGAAPRRSR